MNSLPLRLALLLLLTACAHHRLSRPWSELPPKRQAAQLYRSAQDSIAAAQRASQPIVLLSASPPGQEISPTDATRLPSAVDAADAWWVYRVQGWDGVAYWVGLERFEGLPVALTAIVAPEITGTPMPILVQDPTSTGYTPTRPRSGRCWYRGGAGERRPLNNPGGVAVWCPQPAPKR